MRTWIVTLALAASIPTAAHAHSPTWQTNYSAAQRQAIAQQKPLAVVFGQGANGWLQLGGGTLSPEAQRQLADDYVCCYIDTTAPAGHALARSFEIASIGLVISDRTGAVQAFWHDGRLAADALTGYVSKYADPDRFVSVTDTNAPRSATSYYPPAAAQPFFASPMSFGQAGCST